jgi:alkylation response protein AidB-like acyl-CoA dehydrogenase
MQELKTFPKDREARRTLLLERVASIAPILKASGPKSEDLGTLAPEAVAALREAGMFRLKLPLDVGGAEADALTEMLVLEELAYADLTSAWCTMVGATGVASLGAFLQQPALDRIFKGGRIPTASISFFPAGRARPDGDGYRVSGRWRFNSGIRHAEWAVGGTILEGTEADNGGRPLVVFSVIPTSDVTLHDNWGGVTGLRGTGSVDFSIDNYYLPKDQTFVWDLLHPKPVRGGPSYLFPPFSYVAKEHGAVAIGAARRALDEIVAVATTTQGTYRPSKLPDRQVFQRFVAESDIKVRSARALMHERYGRLYDKVAAGHPVEGEDIADVRAICLYATDVAMGVANGAFHFAGNTGLHHPHVIGRLLRDLNTAGIHQVMSDTAYENHGKYRMGVPSDPLA